MSNSEGVVLAHNNISLSLVNGRYQLIINNFQLEVQKKVVLNMWQNINIQTYHGDVMMKVDNEEAHVNILDRLEKNRIFGKEMVISGFTGCIRGLLIDNKQMNLIRHVRHVIRLS